MPLNFDPQRRPRRQDWNGELIETGMIYVAKKSILQRGVFQNERFIFQLSKSGSKALIIFNYRCGFVEVHPDDELEIDSPTHLQLANVLIKLRTTSGELHQCNSK